MSVSSRLRRTFVSLAMAVVTLLSTQPSMDMQADASPSAVTLIRWTPTADHGIWVYPSTAKWGGQDNFVDKVVRAIDATPRGATIRMSAHGSSDSQIFDALFRAIDRQVNVRYITWHKDYARDGKRYIDRLKSLLGTNVDEKHYVHICRGSCNIKGSDYTHHTKLILIDNVVNEFGYRSRYLVFTGSSNATPGSSSKSWQHNQLLVGRVLYYSAMTHYFDDMRHERTRSYVKPIEDGNLTVYFYPTRKPVNPQLELLKDVSSCTAKKGSGVGGRTKIDFMMFSWSASMRAIADRLVDLRADHCKVRVAITADQVDKTILRILKKGSVTTYNTRATGQFNHAKLLAVSGTVNGKAANIIVSGSLNASVGAMRKNDEYLVKTTRVRVAVLEAFRFFDNMARNSKRMYPAR